MTKQEAEEIFGKRLPNTPPLKQHKKLSRTKKTSTNTKLQTKVLKMTSEEYRDFRYKEMKEDEHQEELIKWLDANNLYFEIGLEGIFLPNPHPKGTRAYAIQMASNQKIISKMKKQGLRKGVADIKVYLDTCLLHIELKRVKKGTHTSEQKQNEKIINSYSYSKYRVCKGVREAKSFIEENIKSVQAD